jgi:hypothetical protein
MDLTEVVYNDERWNKLDDNHVQWHTLLVVVLDIQSAN